MIPLIRVLFSRQLIYSIVFIFANARSANAQTNLVPNNSFESYTNCPNNQGELTNFVNNWYDPSASSDYFNVCNLSGTVDVPSNFVGFQNSFTGNCYAGLITFINNFIFPDAREYIQVQLTDTLKQGHSYIVSFYISLADSVNFACRSIGALFSNSAVSPSCSTCQINSSPQIVSDSTIILSDKTNWTLITDTMTASGGELFLTIGNFKNDALSGVTPVAGAPGYDYSYYYIDEVSVEEYFNLDLGANISACPGDLIQIGVPYAVGYSYQWSPTTGLNNPFISNPICSPLTTTTYLLTATSADTVLFDLVTVTVNDTCGDVNLFVPSAFSPNGDNNNDVLYVRARYPIDQLEFKVFDRWGEVVFSTTNPLEGWNGKYKNKELSSAVFFYYAKVTIKGREYSTKGNVTLIK